MAVSNSSGALSLVRYPEAPARSTRTPYCSAGWTLSTRTGTLGRSSQTRIRILPSPGQSPAPVPGQHHPHRRRAPVARDVGRGRLPHAEQPDLGWWLTAAPGPEHPAPALSISSFYAASLASSGL